jgi:PBP1b-binding outer membrane lipoprotein LpoB
MKKLKRVLVLLLSVVLFNVSCSSEDSPNSNFCENYIENIEGGLQDYSAAVMAQYENPTDANCTALKNEIQKMITTIESGKECFSDSETESYNELITELREHLNSACD